MFNLHTGQGGAAVLCEYLERVKDVLAASSCWKSENFHPMRQESIETNLSAMRKGAGLYTQVLDPLNMQGSEREGEGHIRSLC